MEAGDRLAVPLSCTFSISLATIVRLPPDAADGPPPAPLPMCPVPQSAAGSRTDAASSELKAHGAFAGGNHLPGRSKADRTGSPDGLGLQNGRVTPSCA
jgi:hypothetical protein